MNRSHSTDIFGTIINQFVHVVAWQFLGVFINSGWSNGEREIVLVTR